MTLTQALRKASAVLTAASIEDAPLVSEVLLMDTLKIGRAQLYLDTDLSFTPEQETIFWRSVERSLKGEPPAYITGHREFYGLDFYVDRRVLIPRPESELLVETTIQLAKEHSQPSIVDIGTGCGAIAICLALNLPQAKIFATDISASALDVARRNCRRHGVVERICLLDGEMLDPLPQPVDFVIANLPYVRESDLPAGGPLSFEPRLALDGGTDGLDKVRQLCHRLSEKLCAGGHLLLEIGQGQAPAVAALLSSLFPGARTGITPDLQGIDRVISLGPIPS